MSRKIRVLGASLLGLSLAGPAVAADPPKAAPAARAPATSPAMSPAVAPNVVCAEAALERARTSNSTSKVGALQQAQRNQLSNLIAEANAGKTIEPGAIDALMGSVGH